MGEQLYSEMIRRRPLVSIQARMDSRRLPGKTLLRVMDRPLLSYQLERLRSLRVVVATTDLQADDRIVAEALRAGVQVYRGSPDDVPARHLGVARAFGADVIGFCGADQVFVSAEHFRAAFQRMAQDDCDYVRVVGLPHGLHVWAVTRKALEACVADTHRTPDEIEHTGAYWDARPEQFRTVDFDMGMASEYRLTVDTVEDFELHRLLLEDLYPKNPAFTVDDIIALLDTHPSWAAINRDVAQYYWPGAPHEGVPV